MESNFWNALWARRFLSRQRKTDAALTTRTPADTATPIPMAIGILLATFFCLSGSDVAVLVLLATSPDVAVFAFEVFTIVAPVVLSKIATPIPMEKGLKLPLPDSEIQSPDVAFQPMPQQKSPVPVSETIEIEMPPFGRTAPYVSPSILPPRVLKFVTRTAVKVHSSLEN